MTNTDVTMLNKWRESQHDFYLLQDFYTWLTDHNGDLETKDMEGTLEENKPDNLFYRFLEIDIAKLEEERRNLLNKAQQVADELEAN